MAILPAPGDSSLTESFETDVNRAAFCTRTGFTLEGGGGNFGAEIVSEKANRGVYSMKFTRDGTAGTRFARLKKANISGGANFTISGWFCMSPLSSDARQPVTICRLGYEGTPPDALNLRLMWDPTWRCWRLNCANLIYTYHVYAQSPGPPIYDGQWHQFVWQTSGWGTGTVTAGPIYIDGVRYDWTSSAFSLTNTPNYCHIGIVRQDVPSTDAGFSLYMDDLRIDTAILQPLADVVAVKTVPLRGGDEHRIYVTAATQSVQSAHMTVGEAATGGYVYPAKGPAGSTTVSVTAYGSDSRDVQVRTFTRPGRKLGQDVRILCVSDPQNYAYALGDMTETIGTSPDCVLVTGDYTAIQSVGRATWEGYSWEQRWQRWGRNLFLMKPHNMSAYEAAVAGNHDWVGTPGDSLRTLDHFKDTLPVPAADDPGRKWFSFDIGRAHIVCVVDMEVWPTYPMHAEFWEWLKRDLRSTSQPYRVVVTHYHMYWSPDNPGDKHYPQDENPAHTGHPQRALFRSVFKDCGVDLVISGHRHCHNFYQDGNLFWMTVCNLGGGSPSQNEYATAYFINRTSSDGVVPGPMTPFDCVRDGGFVVLDITEEAMTGTVYTWGKQRLRTFRIPNRRYAGRGVATR